MNIKRAKEELKQAIEAYLWKDAYGNYEIPAIRQRPLLLIGPPGVGKTQIMEQVAKECKIALVAYTITHHTRQSAVGLPRIERRKFGGKEYSVTEYTMSEIVGAVYEKMEATGLKEGILFIDEINCVSETLAPTMLQFLQAKTFGTHRIPEGWLIVAAGNPPEYNKSVREFDVVTLDRIRRLDIEPDFSVWKEYAYQENIHPAVVSYLNIKKQNFCQIETTVDGRRFVTPRGWEDLSRLLSVYEKMGKTADREVVVQYLQHPKIAKDFANYLMLYEKYQKDYQVEEILSGKVQEAVYDKIAHGAFDERLSLTGLLLSRLGAVFGEVLFQEEVIQRVMGILRRFREMENAGAGERISGLIRQTEEEWETLTKQELLNRKENQIYRNVLERLEGIRQRVYDWEQEQTEKAETCAAWEFLQEEFGKDSDAFEEEFARAGQMLEYGFDFMEAAFGDSQEMVIFITELNANPSCVYFLKAYECERYYEYNQKLMFTTM